MRCVLVGTASSAILYTNAHLLNSKLDHIVDNYKPSASDPAKTCDGGIPGRRAIVHTWEETCDDEQAFGCAIGSVRGLAAGLNGGRRAAGAGGKHRIEDRLRRRDQRPGRRLGHLERALDADPRGLAERDSAASRSATSTYDIEIVTFDDQKDPKRAIAGMEKMAQEGIHYVVGPNVDDGAAAVRPVAEKNGHHLLPLRLPEGALYRARLERRPRHGRELPVGPGDLQIPDGKQGREEGRLRRRQRIRSAAASATAASPPPRRSGLRCVADKDTYQNDTRDFTPVLTPVVQTEARPAGAVGRRRRPTRRC